MTKFTEEDIRPQRLFADQRTAALTDLGRMLSRCSEFVHVQCPACLSADSEPRFDKNGIRYVTCRSCATFYVTPRPTPEVLQWFYAGSPNYAYWNNHIFPATEVARRQHIFAPRADRVLDLCSRHGVHPGSLLEVGAGFGTFCAEMATRGQFSRIVGIEPTPELAATCRERGIEVFQLPVEEVDVSQAGSFDVVAGFEVIEHLFNPKDFVGHVKRFLRPGGIVVLTCPNGQGFDVQALGALSNSVDHEHLNYFNPSSLSLLLERGGFELLECFTPGQLDAELVRNQVLSGAFSLDDQPFLKTVLLDNWEQHGQAFQDFLVARGLSSNMWAVARNPVTS